MVQDFGVGLTVDELIGMTAWQIYRYKLPPGEAFQTALKAAKIMVERGMELFVLMELWGDGHCVWRDFTSGEPVVVTPNGQLICTQS